MDPRRSRSAGILLHPTSLPGPFGVGDLGPAAERFLDWLVEAGQSAWQILPLGPTTRGNSPYSALSSFAGHGLLLSPERLADDGLLSAAEVDRMRSRRGGDPTRVDLARVGRRKERMLRRAWARWQRAAPPALLDEHERFQADPARASWLEDWALFAALRRAQRGRGWVAWDEGLRRRSAAALERARARLADEVRYEAFVQFLFDRQWSAIADAARRRGVRIVGDLPFYAALDSADVWAHQELFALDRDGRPLRVSGVPPDAFSDTGQLWRQPVYRWSAMRAEGFAWWVERVRHHLRGCDLLRLDHFRGFAACWEVPAHHRTAVRGRWVPGPGAAPFRALGIADRALPLLAEDLGEITADVHELRRQLGLPGMKVLQFAFDDPHSEHRPEHHTEDCVVYTGTHDNDTTTGWFDGLDERRRGTVLEEIGGRSGSIARDMIRTAYDSPAWLAIVPLQDVLGLGSGARMNVPGRSRGNWSWRASPGAMAAATAEGLRELALRSSRFGAV